MARLGEKQRRLPPVAVLVLEVYVVCCRLSVALGGI